MDKITMQKNPQTMTMNQLFKKFIFVKELDNLSVESISYYLDCFKFLRLIN